MTPIIEQDFSGNLLKLITETFEGPPDQGGSAYLDKGAGLFQTIRALPAHVASQPPYPDATTIAAHCAHASYYLRVLHDFILGREPVLDWPGSWGTREVDEVQWEVIRDDLAANYARLKETLSSRETWSDDSIGDSMAILAHTAYHLGAIRQIAGVVNR